MRPWPALWLVAACGGGLGAPPAPGPRLPAPAPAPTTRPGVVAPILRTLGEGPLAVDAAAHVVAAGQAVWRVEDAFTPAPARAEAAPTAPPLPDGLTDACARAVWAGADGEGWAIDACAGLVIRWGPGWRVGVDLGPIGEHAWGSIRDGGIDTFDLVDGAVRWRRFDDATIVPATRVRLALPGGGQRTLPQPAARVAVAPSFDVRVTVPDGFAPAGAWATADDVVVVGELPRAEASPGEPATEVAVLSVRVPR